MRALFLLPLLFAAACTSIARVNGDYFVAGPDIGRFEADNEACGIAANDYVAYDLKGMDGTPYDQNRAYNGVYTRCMASRGHAPRPYSRNWLPGG